MSDISDEESVLATDDIVLVVEKNKHLSPNANSLDLITFAEV